MPYSSFDPTSIKKEQYRLKINPAYPASIFIFNNKTKRFTTYLYMSSRLKKTLIPKRYEHYHTEFRSQTPLERPGFDIIYTIYRCFEMLLFYWLSLLSSYLACMTPLRLSSNAFARADSTTSPRSSFTPFFTVYPQ